MARRRLKITDCFEKTTLIPPEVKRALTKRTRQLAEREGIDPTEAAKRVVAETREVIRKDLAAVSAALTPPKPAAAPEPGAEQAGQKSGVRMSKKVGQKVGPPEASEHVQGVAQVEQRKKVAVKITPEVKKKLADNLEAYFNEKKIPPAERDKLREQYLADLAEDYENTVGRNSPTGEDPWKEGLEPSGVKFTKPTKGEKRRKAVNEWAKMPYTFDQVTPGESVTQTVRGKPGVYERPEQRAKLVNDLAGKLVTEVDGIVARAKKGNKQARIQLRQRYWYANVVKLLRQWHGGFSDVFADLLGALSPKTDVDLNWRYAVEALRKLMRGDYDAQLAKFDAYLRNGGLAGNFKKEHPADVIVQENNALFGMNSDKAMVAMLDLWRLIKAGDAPKARNFAKNLIGLSYKATIDVWAARGLQRMAYDLAKEQGRTSSHLGRIPAIAETAVGGDHIDAERVGGAFGLGQDAFAEAAARLRASNPKLFRDLTAADLQALLWFREKQIWYENKWSYKEGGSIEANIDVQQAGRIVAGIAQQRSARPGRPEFIPSTAAQTGVAKPLQDFLTRLPGVLAARVKDTWGRFIGNDERSFDLEVLTDPTVDVDAIVQELARLGAAADQDSIFISRVLDPKEENENARPGLEVYFADVVPESMVQPIMDLLRKHEMDGFTLVVDPRTAPEGAAPPGRFRGIRFQYVPEFKGEQYDPKKIDAANTKLRRLTKEILKLSGVAHVGLVQYDTLVLNRNEYDNTGVIEKTAGGVKARGWTGRSNNEASRRRDQSDRASRAHNLPTIYDGGQEGRARAPGRIRQSLAADKIAAKLPWQEKLPGERDDDIQPAVINLETGQVGIASMHYAAYENAGIDLGDLSGDDYPLSAHSDTPALQGYLTNKGRFHDGIGNYLPIQGLSNEGGYIDLPEKGIRPSQAAPAAPRRTEAPARQARQVADDIQASMPRGPTIVVVESTDEAASMYGEHPQVAGDILNNRPEAFYDPDTDTVILIAENFAPEQNESLEHYVTRKVMHEAAGHGGLARLFEGGPLEAEHKAMMGAAYAQLRDQDFGAEWARAHGYHTLQELADSYGFDLSTPEGILRTMDEHLSRLAEDPAPPQWFDGFVTALTSLLRRLGFEAWTDSDTRALLQRARDEVGMQRDMREATSDLRYSKTTRDAASSPAKQRGFVKSVKEAAEIAPDIKDRVEGVYEPITNKETLAAANAWINKQGIDGALDKLRGKRHPTARDYAAGIEMMTRLQVAERYDEAAELAMLMAERATGQGQAIQALSMLSKFTAEGIQVYAARVMNKAVEKSPELQEAQAEIERLRKELRAARRQVAERSIVKATQGSVAQRIRRQLIDNPKSIWGRYKEGAVNQLASKLLGPGRPRGVPALEAFTRRLTRNLAGQLPRGELRGAPSRPSPVDEAAMLGEAARNFDKYQEVWKEAQAYVQDMFKDDPEALQSLDDYFGQILERPFSQASLERAIKQNMQELNLVMREILASAPAAKEATRKALTDAIVDKSRLEGDDARALAEEITKEYQKGLQQERDRLLKRIQPKVRGERKSEIDKLIERNNQGMLDDSRFFSYLASTYGVSVWSPELSERVRQAQKDYDAVDAKKTPELKLAKAAQMFDIIHDVIPKDAWARVAAVQNLAMLLNPKTVIRNVIGNVVLFAVEVPADAFHAWVVDPMIGLITGQRTRASVEVAARLRGLARPIKDIAEGYQFARERGLDEKASLKEGVKTLITLGRIMSRGSYSVSDLNGQALHTFSSPFMRRLEDLLTVALAAGDRAFYDSAYQGSIARQMTLAKKQGSEAIAPTQEMIDIALEDAARAIYQDENLASKILGGLRRELNFRQKWGIGSVLFAFTQVPGSILLRGAEWSPLGAIRVLYELGGRKLLTGEFSQDKLGQAITRAALGTGALVATGFWLYGLGVLSGPPDEDDDLEAFRRASGLGKYRINLSALKRVILSGNWWTKQTPQEDDVTMNYDWAQPVAMPLAMGAEFGRQQERATQAAARGEEPVWWLERTGQATLAALGTLEDQPLFTGLTRWAGRMRDPTVGPIQATVITAVDIPSVFLPTMVRQVNDLMSNQARETRAGNPWARAINDTVSRIPGVSENFPPKYDVFGQAQEKYGYGGNSFFNVLFNPATLREVKSSPASKEIEAVYAATGESGVLPKRVKTTLSFHGEKVELTNEQISAYQKNFGEFTVRGYTRLAASPKFAGASAATKAKYMTKVLEAAHEVAKRATIRGDRELRQGLKGEHRQTLQIQRNLRRMPAPAGP